MFCFKPCSAVMVAVAAALTLAWPSVAGGEAPAVGTWPCAGANVTAWHGNMSLVEVQQWRRRSERLFLSRVPTNRWIYFLHQHKSAGTTFCRLAMQQQKLAVPTPFKNCLPTLPNGKLVSFGSMSAVAQCAMFERSEAEPTGLLANVQMFAEEFNGLAGAVVLGAPWLMVTSFRHPLERLASNFLMDTSLRYVKRDNMTFDEYALGHQYSLHLTDNYEVRQLAGLPRTRNGGPTVVTEAEYRTACNRLHLFSAIIILEDWDATIEPLVWFGWKHIAKQQTKVRNRNHGTMSSTAFLARWGREHPHLMDRLHVANQWSLALYRVAQHVSMELVAAGRPG